MKLTKIFTKLTLISFMLFSFLNLHADGHKNKTGPELEYFGTLSYADITRINDYKRNFIADIHNGTLTLANGDKGNVASPCADYGNVQKERTLDLDVKCSIKMEDGSELFIFYGGKQIMDEKSDQLIKDGKTLTPKNGIEYWISAPLIRTSSEKYDYMNYIQLIGKGKKAIMSPPISVTYELYKVIYEK